MTETLQTPEVTEEMSQASFDELALHAALIAAREEIAQSKIRYYAAKKGFDGFGSASERRSDVSQLRRYIDMLRAMLEVCRDEGGIPEPVDRPVKDAQDAPS
jgi:hypothetical protein